MTTTVVLLVADLVFGVWLVGSPDPPVSKWVGAANFFGAGLMVAMLADDFLRWRIRSHG